MSTVDLNKYSDNLLSRKKPFKEIELTDELKQAVTDYEKHMELLASLGRLSTDFGNNYAVNQFYYNKYTTPKQKEIDQTNKEVKAKEDTEKAFNFLNVMFPSTWWNGANTILGNLNLVIKNPALKLGFDTLSPTALGLGIKGLKTGALKLATNNAIRSMNASLDLSKYASTLPNHLLYRYNVYRGSKPGSWFTTDKLYAKLYGEVKPYIIEGEKVYPLTEPLIGYKDPITMDMAINDWTKGDFDSKSIILGHDLPTKDMPYSSKGTEFMVMDPDKLVIHSIKPTEKISLAFFENPSYLSLREKLGLPKGSTVYTEELNIAFRDQINEFAKKYGYKPIDESITDPKILERYARDMISRHNSFYRGVQLPTYKKDLSIICDKLGNNVSEELVLKYIATHPRDNDVLFMSPYYENASIYGGNGKVAIISRPYHLGTDRTKWFTEGDFPIYEAGNMGENYLPNNTIYNIWEKPRFEIKGVGTYKLVDPQSSESYNIFKTNYSPPDYNSPSELISNSPMIFRKWQSTENTPLSLNWAKYPWQQIVFKKQGGTINYLKFYK